MSAVTANNLDNSAGPSSDDRAEGPTRRLQLLLIAPALDGTDISEGAVAYQWASRLATRHNVTILTYYKRNATRANDQIPQARFVNWRELPMVERTGQLNHLVQPSYAPFYIGARRWIRAALARGEHFDLAHQLTPMSARYPSPAAGLVSPLVLGPIGGGLPTPAGFESELEADPWYTRLRSVDRWRLRHDRLLRRSFMSAAIVIGTSQRVADLLADVPIRRFEVMSEHAVDSLPRVPERTETPGRLRCLFAGRLIRTKGARDAIRALHLLSDMPGITLDIAGEGRDRDACEAEAEALGVADRVRFHGRISRRELNKLYESSDVFLFPSFREPAGGVIIEAMSFGLPVVAADYGGPAEFVRDDTGIRVNLSEPRRYPADLSDALRQLAEDSVRREAMGHAARAAIESDFLWEPKIKQLERIYEEALRMVC